MGNLYQRETWIHAVKQKSTLKHNAYLYVFILTNTRVVKEATHSSGSSNMQRVPKPGLFSNTSPKYLIWASIGRSLLKLTIISKLRLQDQNPKKSADSWWQRRRALWFCASYAHLKKVYCCPYIQGLRVRLGYSPKGGTITVNIKARKTKLAGSTIYQRQRQKKIGQIM